MIDMSRCELEAEVLETAGASVSQVKQTISEKNCTVRHTQVCWGIQIVKVARFCLLNIVLQEVHASLIYYMESHPCMTTAIGTLARGTIDHSKTRG